MDVAGWSTALAAGADLLRAGERPRRADRDASAWARARCGARAPADRAAPRSTSKLPRARCACIGFLHSGNNPRDAKGRYVAGAVRTLSRPRRLGVRMGAQLHGRNVSCETIPGEDRPRARPARVRRISSDDFTLGLAASTIRTNLADLEDMGHARVLQTSAGTVPIYVVPALRRRHPRREARSRCGRGGRARRRRSEIDDALRETADAPLRHRAPGRRPIPAVTDLHGALDRRPPAAAGAS